MCTTPTPQSLVELPYSPLSPCASKRFGSWKPTEARPEALCSAPLNELAFVPSTSVEHSCARWQNTPVRRKSIRPRRFYGIRSACTVPLPFQVFPIAWNWKPTRYFYTATSHHFPQWCCSVYKYYYVIKTQSAYSLLTHGRRYGPKERTRAYDTRTIYTFP